MNAAWGRRLHCSKRSGFTLVELLIVIIIIGILAGAMLLVRQRGQDSDDATVIINDLRTMKAAALMFDADNPKRDLTPLIGGNAIKHLEKFMDRPVDETRDYLFIYPEMPSGGGSFPEITFKWYVFRMLYTMPSGGGIPQTATEGCRKKLEDMAESTGLLGFGTAGFSPGMTDRPFVAADMIVGMRVK
jgi:prepilin-type N-terminal cleavage/methylation domain-containing protein